MKKFLYIGIGGVLAVSVFAWKLDLFKSEKTSLETNGNEAGAVTEKTKPQDLSNMEVAFTMNKGNADYVATSASDLYESSSIVLVGKFVKDNKNYAKEGSVDTESNFKVDRVLKGTLSDAELKKGVNVNYYGGEVLLDDYLNSLDPERLNSPKMPKFTQNERKTKKVVMKMDKQANKDRDKNSQVMIFLSDDHFVQADSYGMRKIDNKGNVFNPDTNTFEKVSFYTK